MSIIGDLLGVELTDEEQEIVDQCEEIKTYAGARIAILRETCSRNEDVADISLGLFLLQRFSWAGAFEMALEGRMGPRDGVAPPIQAWVKKARISIDEESGDQGSFVVESRWEEVEP